MQVQPDATGGLKSFLPDLRGTLTKGLEYVVAGELSKRYGFSFGADDTLNVNTHGDVTPKGKPAPTPSATDEAASLLKNPLIAAAVIAAAIAVVIAVVRR